MDFFAGHLPELIIVLVLVLIIWGPAKLPDISAAVGRDDTAARGAGRPDAAAGRAGCGT